jgi:hypothetical protein
MNPEVTKKWRDAFFGRGGIKKKKGENFGAKSKGRMTHK